MWERDFEADDEVAATAIARDALARHPQMFFRAFHRRDFYLERLPFQSFDWNDGAEERVGELHGEIHNQIRSFAPKDRMRFYMYLHIEIARDTRLDGLALLRHTYHLAVINASRNSDFYFFLFALHAVTFAFCTFLFRYFPAAVADGAGAHTGELSKNGVACFMHAAATVTGFTGFELGTRLRTGTVA